MAFLRSLKVKDLRLSPGDASALDVIKDVFKLPRGICSLEVVESSVALEGGSVVQKIVGREVGKAHTS